MAQSRCREEEELHYFLQMGVDRLSELGNLFRHLSVGLLQAGCLVVFGGLKLFFHERFNLSCQGDLRIRKNLICLAARLLKCDFGFETGGRDNAVCLALHCQHSFQDVIHSGLRFLWKLFLLDDANDFLGGRGLFDALQEAGNFNQPADFRKSFDVRARVADFGKKRQDNVDGFVIQ